MTQRQHRMPFGAEIQPDGRVRFRLWAPAVKQVNLYWRSKNAQAEIAMNAAGGGWFSVETGVSGDDVDYGFRIDAASLLPDPASRLQAHDVHGLSRLVDPNAWMWRDEGWKGRPWGETVIYELHIGTFTPSGDFTGVIARLEHLIALGITAIQLMPVADFPGQRNWGYDGVLPFAPDSRYGTPDDLKLLVQTAHSKGLMVFLDVVYNHFGPEGNYLHRYAPQFFSARHQTPWGDAINFDAEGSAVVRQFFIHNALYWLEEYHLDGLRFDAVHGVFDDSEPSIWEAIAQAVYDGPGAHRPIHLILENDNNTAHLLRRYGRSQNNTVDLSSAKPSPKGQICRERIWSHGERPQGSGQDSPETLGWVRGNQNKEKSLFKSPHPNLLPVGEGALVLKSTAWRSQAYTAQWNDDFHHTLHVLLSGETQGYYGDYAQDPLRHLARCLTEGFAYQGEASPYRNGKPRGEPSVHLPPTAFIGFLQNHDQIGNRAGGERLTTLTSAAALRAATALLLLAPFPPLLFMGQEWGCTQPFCYFCDFAPELNAKVWEGRRREFAKLPGFQTSGTPNPASAATFERCRLDWSVLDAPEQQAWLALHRDLLNIRHAEIIPRLHGIAGGQAHCRLFGISVIQAEWLLGDRSHLTLLANLGAETAIAIAIASPPGRPLYVSHDLLLHAGRQNGLPPWSVGWFLQTPCESS